MLKNEPKLAIVAVHTEENEPPKVQESPEKILFKPVELRFTVRVAFVFSAARRAE